MRKCPISGRRNPATGHCDSGPYRLATAAGITLNVGLLAAVGPARRGLRIQPTEALRADG